MNMARWLMLVLVGGGFAESPERTCNIPVFRYALERWQPSSYEVIAVHQGPLTDEAREALSVLRQSGANVELDRIDVLEPVPEKRRGLLEKVGLKPPFLVALYPD